MSEKEIEIVCNFSDRADFITLLLIYAFISFRTISLSFATISFHFFAD